MKRRDLIKVLESKGCSLVRHGGRHDWYTNPKTKQSQPIPRHREINENLAKFPYPHCPRWAILAVMSTADAIYKAVKPLPEPLAREILDFVEFVRTRSQAADRDLMKAQQASLSAIWNNAEDEVWN